MLLSLVCLVKKLIIIPLRATPCRLTAFVGIIFSLGSFFPGRLKNNPLYQEKIRTKRLVSLIPGKKDPKETNSRATPKENAGYLLLGSYPFLV